MRVAVIGSGIAGVGAADALGGRHHVEVFEAAPRLGGHTYTVEVAGRRGPVAVDMGFIVCNQENYPRLFRLFGELGVVTRPTSMAFSVSLPALGIEWGSASVSALFADRTQLWRRAHWAFLAGVLRLLRQARRDLASGALVGRSLDEYLDQAGVPADVREQFVIPLAAALWSLAPDQCGAFPAETYVRFLDQHGMLRPVRPLQWRTVVGGSQRYLDALLARGRFRTHVGTPVRAVHRDAAGVTLELGGAGAGQAPRFDRVIVATHGDQALGLLAEPTEAERAVLGAFRYSANRTVLHRDERLLPRRPAARASWNYVADPDRGQVAVTYWMNALQGLTDEDPLLVTLNPRGALAAGAVLHEAAFTHPQFDTAGLAAARAMPRIQGTQRTYYAGAHLGFGFHEDGLRAGQLAAGLAAVDEHRAATGGAA